MTPTTITYDATRHCGATTNALNGATPCRNAKGTRTDHPGSGACWLHGGTSPNGRTHAAREAAATALERMGVPVSTDPMRALYDVVCEAAGNVAFLRQEVGKLGLELVGDRLAIAQRDGIALPVGEEERAIVRLYGEWTDRLAKYAKAAIDAGLDERMVRLAESHADVIARVIESVLAGLELAPDVHERGRIIAAGELRRLAALPVVSERA